MPAGCVCGAVIAGTDSAAWVIGEAVVAGTRSAAWVMNEEDFIFWLRVERMFFIKSLLYL